MPSFYEYDHCHALEIVWDRYSNAKITFKYRINWLTVIYIVSLHFIEWFDYKFLADFGDNYSNSTNSVCDNGQKNIIRKCCKDIRSIGHESILNEWNNEWFSLRYDDMQQIFLEYSRNRHIGVIEVTILFNPIAIATWTNNRNRLWNEIWICDTNQLYRFLTCNINLSRN